MANFGEFWGAKCKAFFYCQLPHSNGVRVDSVANFGFSNKAMNKQEPCYRREDRAMLWWTKISIISVANDDNDVLVVRRLSSVRRWVWGMQYARYQVHCLQVVPNLRARMRLRLFNRPPAELPRAARCPADREGSLSALPCRVPPVLQAVPRQLQPVWEPEDLRQRFDGAQRQWWRPAGQLQRQCQWH